MFKFAKSNKPGSNEFGKETGGKGKKTILREGGMIAK